MTLDLTASVKNLTNTLSVIVAVSNNWAIGKKGAMPWHIPEDLKYFKKKTLSKPILMGGKTFKSLGKPLPGRANIIVSESLAQSSPTNWDLSAETSLNFCANLPEGLKLADELANKMQTYEIMIIGGGSIYAQLLPYTNKLYISRINIEVKDADTFFPPLDKKNWVLENKIQKDTFIAEVWQNIHSFDKNLDLSTPFTGNLSDLTNQIETKLEEVLHLFNKMSLKKQSLQSQVVKTSLKNVRDLEKAKNTKNTDYREVKPADSKVEIEDNKSFMENMKTPTNWRKEQPKQEKSAQAPVENTQKAKPDVAKTRFENQTTNKKTKVDEILEFWQKKYPKTFFDQEAKPLKIGIHLDLLQTADFSEKMIKRALAHYTKRPRYLRSMQEGAFRVDFNGETEVKVTKDDEQDAKRSLEVIRKRHKERDAKNPKKSHFKKNWKKGNTTEKGAFKKTFSKGTQNSDKPQTKIYKKTTFKKPLEGKNSSKKLDTDRTQKPQTLSLKTEDAQRLQTKLQKLSDKFSKSN